MLKSDTMNADGLIAISVILGVVCGLISAVIASKKNRSALGFFFLGLLLGVFGIVGAAIAQPATPSDPPAPPGLTAAVCPRCNARQNVPAGQPNFDCWQCHMNVPTPSPVPIKEPMSTAAKVQALSATGVLVAIAAIGWTLFEMIFAFHGKAMHHSGTTIFLGLVACGLGVSALVIQRASLVKHRWAAAIAITLGAAPLVLIEAFV